MMEKLYFTPSQERIVDLHKVYSGKGICNIAGKICLKGVYGEELLSRALQTLVDEIPAFRISINEGEEPCLLDIKVQLERWKGDERPSAEQLSQWLQIPFGVKNVPLCGFCYYELTDNTEIYIKVHHLLFDSYGVVLCINRLANIIDSMKKGKKLKADTDWRYIDNMKYRHLASQKALDWYENQYQQMDSSTWVYKGTCHGKTEAFRKRYCISGALFQMLKLAEKEKKSSLEIMFSASAAIYFSRILGTEDFCFGRSLLNRRKEDMDVPGMMANTLPVFLKIIPRENYWEICRNLKYIFFQMMRYSGLSYAELKEKLDIHQTLYDVMITYRKPRYIPFIDGIEQEEIYNYQMELPLRIYIDELDEEVRLDFQYQTECYTDQEIDAVYERLLVILKQGMEGSIVDHISIMSEEDRSLWKSIQPSAADYPKKLLPDRISMQMKRYPDRIALRYHNQKMPYRELGKRSDAVGAYLIEKGVHSGEIVGICLEDPMKIPCVLLGIWKVGASFLPVSVRENPERIQEIQKLCAFFLTDAEAEESLSGCGRSEYIEPEPDSPAYYMFTSGSTGTAKAAVISHLSLACRIQWMEDAYHCSGSVLQKAACTFDVSVWEYFLPLAYGGCVYLTSESEKRDVGKLLELLETYKIETVHFVPSLLSVWLKYSHNKKKTLPYLKHVFSSGEELSPELAALFYQLFSHAKLHNLYGPTECTIDVTFYDCKKEDVRIPIGRPVSWTRIEILDQKKRCLPPGVEGEISIQGVLVGKGYFGQESERFRMSENGCRTFDTGDRGMLGMDGQIYYLGRKDSQCKIHGMRIDLAQIESIMKKFPGVLRAAVLYQQNQITGFYMAESRQSGLEEYLKKFLPYYSIPQRLIYCRDIPLTSNGKIDRRYLERLMKSRKQDTDSTENTRESIIREIISERVGHSVQSDENIFLAGVDSLMVMELILELEKRGMHFTAEDFYRTPVIRKLAEKVSGGYYWLCRRDTNSLVLAFPYAAGQPEDYRELSEKLQMKQVDFCVVHDAGQIPDIKRYKRIVLFGYCTGTAGAMKAAEMLQKKGMPVKGMVLCAAVPPGRIGIKTGSPWRVAGDPFISRFIDYLHGYSVYMKHASVVQFRRDTDIFFRYFAKRRPPLSLRMELFLGEKDILTFPGVLQCKRWKNYFSSQINYHILRGKGHFFFKECSGLLANTIYAMIKGEE